MPRTVLEFAIDPVFDGQDRIKFIIDESPRAGQADNNLQEIDLSTFADAPFTTSDEIKEYGDRLVRALSEKDSFQEVLNFIDGLNNNERCPLYFKIVPGETEEIRWETLNKANEFYALQRQSPIARIAKLHENRTSIPYSFAAPLRVQTFISALGVSGEEEWNVLYKAIQEARKEGLSITCSVFVGESELHNKITQLANNDFDITVAYMPTLTLDIEDEINRFEPHIVHFFCHGYAGAGGAFLKLGTLGNWEDHAAYIDGIGDGEIDELPLAVESIAEVEALRKAWLITLNCCNSARPAGAADNGDGSQHALHSMAYNLVAHTGVPGVVAMQEPVEPLDAHDFSRYFYPSVFETIRRTLPQAPNQFAEIDWAEALVKPRRALQEKHKHSRQWTIPVLYARQKEFLVSRAPDIIQKSHSEESEKQNELLRLLMELLETLPPGTPAEFRQTIINEFVAGLEPAQQAFILTGSPN